MKKRKIGIIAVDVVALCVLLKVAWVIIPGNYRYLTKTPWERQKQEKERLDRRAYSAYLDAWLEANRVASDEFFAAQKRSLDSLQAQYDNASDSLYQKALRCYKLVGRLDKEICAMDSMLAQDSIALSDTSDLNRKCQALQKRRKNLNDAASFYLSEEIRMSEEFWRKTDSVLYVPFVPLDVLSINQFMAELKKERSM